MCEIKRKVILNNVFPNARYMTAVDNLGHETINLFKADNGFYLHLNANGTSVNKIRTNVCILLTKRKGYGIMREYRWEYRLYSFVVPQSRCGVLFHARRGARRKVFRACGERTSPRCFSANCAAPEPSERRAKTGF